MRSHLLSRFMNRQVPRDTSVGADPVQSIAIGVSNLKKSIGLYHIRCLDQWELSCADYWHGLLGLEVFESTSARALLGCSATEVIAVLFSQSISHICHSANLSLCSVVS
jgi:hypothetical protein